MSSSNPFHHHHHPFQQIQEQQPQEQHQLLLQPFYHVPQQSRREKLRYQPPTSNPDHHSLFPTMLPSNNTNNYLSLRGGPAPSEPFTGYVAVLKGSRFLGPAKEMLEEVCGGGGGGIDGCVCGELGVVEDGSDHMHGHGGGVKSRLLAMLDEVYRKYKHYYQQIQYIITSFECVAGLNNAAPYTSLALRSMFKHFQSLKNAIAEQLRFTDKVYGKECQPKDDMRGFGSMSGGSLCYQGMPHNSGVIGQSNVWRPQRGLPERAVAVLKAWLFEHFLHPYPTDTDKHMLAKQTGLSRNQVSNWFINARVRLWKPMVEEIHSLEMRQQQAHNMNKASSDPDNNNNNLTSCSMAAGGASSEPSCSKQQPAVQNISSSDRSHKRFRSELPLPGGGHIEEPVGLFDDFAGHHHQLATLATSVNNNNNNNNTISLTLGLHQNNNGLRMPESVPFNVARRFGLDDTNTSSYVMSGFQVQDRRQMDAGQLLHDFVG